jgi:hypothetical protein
MKNKKTLITIFFILLTILNIENLFLNLKNEKNYRINLNQQKEIILKEQQQQIATVLAFDIFERQIQYIKKSKGL